MAFLTSINSRRLTAGLGFFLLLFLLWSKTEADEDTEAPRVQLGPWAKGLKVGPQMNAVGRQLKGSVFVGQDLRGAAFDGCDLDGVVFYQCNLSGASFKAAHLTGMNITDCRIEGAAFTDAIINGIVGMPGGLSDPPHSGWPHSMRLSDEQVISTRSYKSKDLRKCVISLSDRREPNPPRYDFRGAHLEGACLHHGDFTNCDFTDARIDGIEMLACKIDFEQLASTDNFKTTSLLGARFSTIPFSGKWDLSGMDLTGTREFPGFSFNNDYINFTDADITQCMFGGTITKAQLRSTRSFKKGDLRQITFYHVDFSAFDFSGLNLTGCVFRGCDFTGACFNDAVINDVQFAEHQPYPSKHVFPDFRGLSVAQIKSTWNYRNRDMKGIVLPKELAEALAQRRAPR